MNAEHKKVVRPDESQDTKQSVDKSRRSFTKVGAAVVPVMMTLANRSAWGGTNICTQSGWTSFHNAGNVISSHNATVRNSAWNSPSRWALTPTWPAPYNPTSSTVGDILPGVYPGDQTLATTALNASDIRAYRVATALNYLEDPTVPAFFLSTQDPPLGPSLTDFDTFYKACANR